MSLPPSLTPPLTNYAGGESHGANASVLSLPSSLPALHCGGGMHATLALEPGRRCYRASAAPRRPAVMETMRIFSACLAALGSAVTVIQTNPPPAACGAGVLLPCSPSRSSLIT